MASSSVLKFKLNAEKQANMLGLSAANSTPVSGWQQQAVCHPAQIHAACRESSAQPRLSTSALALKRSSTQRAEATQRICFPCSSNLPSLREFRGSLRRSTLFGLLPTEREATPRGHNSARQQHRGAITPRDNTAGPQLRIRTKRGRRPIFSVALGGSHS
jgi:hypothetical protein